MCGGREPLPDQPSISTLPIPTLPIPNPAGTQRLPLWGPAPAPTTKRNLPPHVELSPPPASDSQRLPGSWASARCAPGPGGRLAACTRAFFPCRAQLPREGCPKRPLPTWWHLCPRPLHPSLMGASVFIKLAHHRCPASGTHLARCNQSLALQGEATVLLHSPTQSPSASTQEVPTPTLHQSTDLTVPPPHLAHTEAPSSPAIFKAGLNSCKVLGEFLAHSHHRHCPSSKSRWHPSLYHIRRNDPSICGTYSNL